VESENARRVRLTVEDHDGAEYQILVVSDIPKPMWSEHAQRVVQGLLAREGLRLTMVRRVEEILHEIQPAKHQSALITPLRAILGAVFPPRLKKAS